MPPRRAPSWVQLTRQLHCHLPQTDPGEAAVPVTSRTMDVAAGRTKRERMGLVRRR